MTAPPPVLVSAIVSTFNAARFIRGCIEDLEGQTISDKIEIIIVDSASEQNEGEIVREFQERYPNIRYTRTEQRESVYAAWNRGIRMARGKYITKLGKAVIIAGLTIRNMSVIPQLARI